MQSTLKKLIGVSKMRTTKIKITAKGEKNAAKGEGNAAKSEKNVTASDRDATKDKIIKVRRIWNDTNAPLHFI